MVGCKVSATVGASVAIEGSTLGAEVVIYVGARDGMCDGAYEGACVDVNVGHERVNVTKLTFDMNIPIGPRRSIKKESSRKSRWLCSSSTFV